MTSRATTTSSLVGITSTLTRESVALMTASCAFTLLFFAVFLALLVHSIFYTGFFDDPYAWLVPALAAGFLLQRGREGESPT